MIVAPAWAEAIRGGTTEEMQPRHGDTEAGIEKSDLPRRHEDTKEMRGISPQMKRMNTDESMEELRESLAKSARHGLEAHATGQLFPFALSVFICFICGDLHSFG